MPYTTRLALNIISVYPSGGECEVSSAAMLPLAPARLSTTTLCPSASVRGVATRRATKSRPPPAPEATIILTGLVGYAIPCAAPCGAAIASATPSPAVMLLRNFCSMFAPGLFGWHVSRAGDDCAPARESLSSTSGSDRRAHIPRSQVNFIVRFLTGAIAWSLAHSPPRGSS